MATEAPQGCLLSKSVALNMFCNVPESLGPKIDPSDRILVRTFMRTTKLKVLTKLQLRTSLIANLERDALSRILGMRFWIGIGIGIGLLWDISYGIEVIWDIGFEIWLIGIQVLGLG